MLNFDIVESGFGETSSPYSAIAFKNSMLSGVPHAQLALGWYVLREGKTFDDLYNTIPSNLRLVKTTIRATKVEKSFGNSDGEYLLFNVDSNNTVAVEGILSSTDQALDLRELWLHNFLERSGESSGRIHIIGRAAGGLALFELGTSNTKFEELNYPSNLEDYAHIHSCLNSKDPCGRLVLIEGSPGTGKSYLIRSIVSSANCVSIFVPSGLVGSLSGPELAPILLSQRQEVNKPVVLILEDADSALIDRKAGNLDSLSTLLNLGDGLFGQLADVRIIATTNTDKAQFDPAVLRPGRLCRHLVTVSLDKHQADAVYSRLVPDHKEAPFNSPVTLAELYRRARKDGWSPANTDKTENHGQYL